MLQEKKKSGARSNFKRWVNLNFFNLYLTLSSLFSSHFFQDNILPWFTCREHDKKVCILGLTSLFSLPAGQLPGEVLPHVFRALLELLVAYKDQLAGQWLFISLIFLITDLADIPIWTFVTEAAKAEEEEEDEDGDDDDMDEFQTDDEDEDGDDENPDETDGSTLRKLAAQVCLLWP